MLEPSLAANSFNQNPPHRLGRGGEEVPPAVPMLGLLDVDEPDVSCHWSASSP